ncbi:carbohydrate ABC transporter permease [Micromonospora sp. DT201]|uniref:carbohydrate ABC transporter permease n=1 Tax=Micromonospora sp. DT201 TaxID=3393442 RepID=UPI003CF5AB6B
MTHSTSPTWRYPRSRIPQCRRSGVDHARRTPPAQSAAPLSEPPEPTASRKALPPRPPAPLAPPNPNGRLTDSLWSLVVTYPTFTLPFATWLLVGYFSSIPVELEEAALVDGCSPVQAFGRVVLPLAKPGLLAVALFTLTNAWNEFLFAFVFITKDEYKTLPVGMQSMIAGDVVPQGQLAAASLLVSIPVVIMYALGQRFLTEGLTAGAVKG